MFKSIESVSGAVIRHVGTGTGRYFKTMYQVFVNDLPVGGLSERESLCEQRFLDAKKPRSERG